MSHYNVNHPKNSFHKNFKNLDPGAFQNIPPDYPPPEESPQPVGKQPDYMIKEHCIKGLYRYTFLSLKTGECFWFCPTSYNRNLLYGWRHTKSRWIYFAVHIRKLASIQCT
ncbi:hypothetical protein AB1L05_18720 [Cytobacillus horneckiae]|uniref:hypothetical protein n=1 Tax=Cytobacillus horneckiae TaxID=549687 RepID=UPI0039A3998D